MYDLITRVSVTVWRTGMYDLITRVSVTVWRTGMYDLVCEIISCSLEDWYVQPGTGVYDLVT